MLTDETQLIPAGWSQQGLSPRGERGRGGQQFDIRDKLMNTYVLYRHDDDDDDDDDNDDDDDDIFLDGTNLTT